MKISSMNAFQIRLSYLDGTNYVNDAIMIGIDLLDLRFLATALS